MTIAIAASACSVDGLPTADTTVRQVDDLGNRLPFATKHSRRWNSGNNGSSYEPCTALASVDLDNLGVDPDSAKDAAGTNGQTLRGCEWKYKGRTDRTLSQFVGNSVSLAHAQSRRSDRSDVWQPKLRIGTRTVGVHINTTGGQCDTYVQSRGAGVITMVFEFSDPPSPTTDICERAIAFTRATIDRMPE
ncbi:DUF3558 family protein [Gordonia malaquae]|uniref:DUF3558 family protein n=1 Tax=Gordonia malaquae TaxID=410332 RepID=UPI003BF8C290